MAKTLVPRTPATPRTLLERILDQPDLLRAVQALPPASLLRLIDRVGLEDAGEVVALMTVDQLRRVFDEDLWRSGRPGEDERFDPARFTLWLEVMLEAGERFAADKLAELPEDLVELALQHHILVISLEELALLISEGEGQVPLEKVLEDRPHLELGDYCVIGRTWEAWETIATVLIALDERHSNSLQPMLERLWRVTNDYVYGQGGLFDVLTSEEMLQSDAAAEREDRRERAGFVAAASARSFLSLARTDDVASLLQAPSRDPITSAFFRYSEMVPLEVDAAGGRASSEPEAGGLRRLLDEMATDAPAVPLLESGENGQAAPTLLTRALVELAGRDGGRHAERIRELGYLANTLLAGAGARGARLRPLDAAQATLATCNLGLERALADSPDDPGGKQERARPETSAARQIERLGCDVLFRVGWRLLHDEVSRPAAAAVERVAMRAARATDAPRERASLERLAAAARTALNEGRPPSYGARLDLLVDALDDRQLALLASLSDDLPAWLSADGVTFERIASTAQLHRARTFLEAL
jgi:hypothetical protein